MRTIQATVTYPITVNIELTKEEVKTIEMGELTIIDTVRERLKANADEIFETSTLNPVITWCNMEGIIE